ncbi:hypothetical protein ABFX02_08G099000 [Erythranthe guttata]
MASSSKKNEIRNQRVRIRYATMSSEDRDNRNATRRACRVSRNLKDPSTLAGRNNQIEVVVAATHLLESSESEGLVMHSYIGNNLYAHPSSTIEEQCVLPVQMQENPIRMHRLYNRFKRISNIATIPWVLPHSPACSYCGAFRFHLEGAAFCCSNGQISLVKSVVCPILYSLFTDTSDIAIEFRRRARTYNNAFAFTSIGMKKDQNSWWDKDGIYALKVVGQVCHFMNSIDGSPNTKDLLQLFFLDTTETINPQILQSKDLRAYILAFLISALSDNTYSIFFKRLKSWDNLQDAHLVIRSNSHLDQRTYNLPTVDDVAAVWKDSDGVSGQCERDFRVFTDSGSAHRVKYHYSCHDPLQYPLLFPKGEPGWHAGIKKMGTCSSPQKRKESCQGQNSTNPANAFSAGAIFEMEEEG